MINYLSTMSGEGAWLQPDVGISFRSSIVILSKHELSLRSERAAKDLLFLHAA